MINISGTEGYGFMSEDMVMDASKSYRERLKSAIMDLTDEQAEYVSWRLQCLKQGDN